SSTVFMIDPSSSPSAFSFIVQSFPPFFQAIPQDNCILDECSPKQSQAQTASPPLGVRREAQISHSDGLPTPHVIASRGRSGF
ncbi:MAG: hypothetical protein ABFD50_13510, partial [Smithella sp.]